MRRGPRTITFCLRLGLGLKWVHSTPHLNRIEFELWSRLRYKSHRLANLIWFHAFVRGQVSFDIFALNIFRKFIIRFYFNRSRNYPANYRLNMWRLIRVQEKCQQLGPKNSCFYIECAIYLRLALNLWLTILRLTQFIRLRELLNTQLLAHFSFYLFIIIFLVRNSRVCRFFFYIYYCIFKKINIYFY